MCNPELSRFVPRLTGDSLRASTDNAQRTAIRRVQQPASNSTGTNRETAAEVDPSDLEQDPAARERRNQRSPRRNLREEQEKERRRRRIASQASQEILINLASPTEEAPGILN